MPDIRQEIEQVLVKDLPSTICCPRCQLDIEWDFDLDQTIDDLVSVIERGVTDDTISLERKH